MKWMNNWEYVLGVNLFNNHGYHYTIEGERKRDWPPSQFYHHTWWKYYDRFIEYNARLSHVLTGGSHVAKGPHAVSHQQHLDELHTAGAQRRSATSSSRFQLPHRHAPPPALRLRLRR
jgi:hypothetical protein